jgi:hypothetical protein
MINTNVNNFCITPVNNSHNVNTTKNITTTNNNYNIYPGNPISELSYTPKASNNMFH